MHLSEEISKEKAKELIQNLKTPEGTAIFDIKFIGLFENKDNKIKYFELETGKLIYIIERDQYQNINFYHSSPGTGTRMASINIDQFKPDENFKLFLVWSPKEISLSMGVPNKSNLVHAVGKPSPLQFSIATDGSIISYTNNIHGIEMYVNGKTHFKNSAIESWRFVIKAAKVLMTGSPPKNDYSFIPVVVNMVIVMLVMGFESYSKSRFLELEEEGIKVDFKNLADAFLSRNEKDNNEIEIIIKDAEILNISPTQHFIEKRKIDFQNYKKSKLAFKKGLNINFVKDLGIEITLLEEIQDLIQKRHKIVHSSLFMTVFNPDQQSSDPVYPTFNLANHFIEIFDLFIQSIHEQTLYIYKKQNR
ncbi:MAG: hypothetical protein DWP98_00310 [Bacteroidetes bacterium]|nr:MAG: hypothetical protein DWP98_00310 [Bacteroidota bacterium]MBL1145331.1 hypothetical protein [Bacteroidota bacterium]MCB0804121.1 hypothetical protein [Flavobacteriales bacterium]NOG58129.1 hypothetical protein [Bacteroidota bacterium]